MTSAKNSQVPAEFTMQVEAEGIIIPPCNLWSDEPPLESDLHREQIELLLVCLKWPWRNRTDFYAERKQKELAQQQVQELLAKLKNFGVDPKASEQ